MRARKNAKGDGADPSEELTLVKKHKINLGGLLCLSDDVPMLLRRLIALSVLIAAAPLDANAESGRVIGDGIGVGISWAAQLPSTAYSVKDNESVTISNRAVLRQLRQAVRGDTVFMSLGLFDAVRGVPSGVHQRVQEIVTEGDALGLRLVWVGPPCVLSPWEKYARKLDAILRRELEGTDVIYISGQDDVFCKSSIHGVGGVFFNSAGYILLWQKAAAVVNFPVVVAEAPAATSPPLSISSSAPVVISPPVVRPAATATSQPDAGAGRDRRFALVIGNSDYKNAALTNPTRDADLVSASLRKAGFDVTEVKDADFLKFDETLTSFVAKEADADIALFYFAGHGFALAGDDLRPRNYLMTTSADMGATSDAALRHDGFTIDEVIKRISQPAKVTLAFIDACRNDPFHRGSGNRGFEPLPISSTRQIYIGMSTHIGRGAIDGVGGLGSPFAQAFVEQMTTPGLRIDDAFRALREEVSRKTEGQQEPEIFQDDLKQGALVLVTSP